MMYNNVKDHLNGKQDKMYTLLNDWMWDDWHRDADDMRMVNWRYSDHVERDDFPGTESHSHLMYKHEADKAKQIFRYYRKGHNSYFDNFVSTWRDAWRI